MAPTDQAPAVASSENKGKFSIGKTAANPRAARGIVGRNDVATIPQVRFQIDRLNNLYVDGLMN